MSADSTKESPAIVALRQHLKKWYPVKKETVKIEDEVYVNDEEQVYGEEKREEGKEGNESGRATV